ncbi:DUF7662 domain-containing protein [Sphingobium indicum]|uniref:DUF7662 domain-containing protein n=1 Tax=Sphingobium indicum (strain DSM 16412 / CCM 7286 / MTCC 6364 / B90A) TaxID=861109 RepID=A0A1L5BRG7_SPHIB|nr:hypothetical protein SIDU_13725 [Sphingobium indicum B90A]
MNQRTTHRLQPLSDFLRGRTDALITLSFSEIEEIIQSELPEYAKSGFGYWANSKSDEGRRRRAFAWLDNHYKAFVDKDFDSITFRRVAEG